MTVRRLRDRYEALQVQVRRLEAALEAGVDRDALKRDFDGRLAQLRERADRLPELQAEALASLDSAALAHAQAVERTIVANARAPRSLDRWSTWLMTHLDGGQALAGLLGAIVGLGVTVRLVSGGDTTATAALFATGAVLTLWRSARS